MFDTFSMRARQVVFAARCKAGERGASMIDVDDFLVGLVLEDQGMLGDNLFSKLPGARGTLRNKAPSHIRFFSHELAEILLTRMTDLLPKLQPVGLSTEIPLSPALKSAFDSAEDFRTQFQSSQTEPLHLLAAILTEESNQGVKILQEAGITQEKVLLSLKGTAEN
jgi:ATP-dependent Clp protease ATP-binding subunit ClpA